ncbi:MAG TPA: trehalase family glycosidase [Anaerolineales bacterium]|nr:trehalase family glycosidase [Anaerolineales bacterium]
MNNTNLEDTFAFRSEYLDLLKNRINLIRIPFTERGSRLLLFRSENHLYIRLAERWFKREGQLAAYRHRAPIIEELVFTDETGRPLEMEITTYPHKVICQTTLGAFTFSFLDSETLLVQLPAGRSGLAFRANLDRAVTDRRGGILRLTGDIRRNIAYTTNARLLSNRIEPASPTTLQVSLTVDADECQSLLLNITPRLGFNRYVPDPATAVEASARHWHAWFEAAPAVAEEYRQQYYFAWWIMRAGLISTRFYTTREAMTPSFFHYVGVWQWDAYFHALAYRHVDKRLAQDQLRILLDHQREDGMIPDAVHDEGTVTHLTYPVDADVTKPPLVSWAVWKLYELDGDREFLDEIYESLVRWNNWWFEKNDLDRNGLCEYLHPYSSGLDDSPLWDSGMPVESPDLNTYLCLQQETLARIARLLGERKDAKQWARRADDMARRMIRRMWDPQAGLFWARRNGARVDVRTPFNLFPLLTGRLPAEINARLVAHLTDENEFWPRFPVPTVALNDPKYSPEQMWRGPTWVNVNYLLIEGLQRTGYLDLARDLRLRTLELIGQQDDVYEYYHPETGVNPPLAASVFGWSSAIFIDLAIQAARETTERREEER